MKVREMIELLQNQDPEAEIRSMSQPSWPYEYSIAGIATRREIAEFVPHRGECRESGTAPSDVFIVEGEQLRGGAKEAWKAVQYQSRFSMRSSDAQ